ncbi:hypothetical protein AO703_13365 [[Enterobacter] lignolyticus]|uniref:Uncharacterized protein n=1 Tax=[Enterobacter] lignolyticus TaxID=1334193 RepID=A0A806XDX3_9ENTR|nr:hypothetical protein AO703_13365 [[Enterobacter] lignolyticus]
MLPDGGNRSALSRDRLNLKLQQKLILSRDVLALCCCLIQAFNPLRPEPRDIQLPGMTRAFPPHVKSLIHIVKCSLQGPAVYMGKYPNAPFLMPANPVMHPFDMATWRELLSSADVSTL